MTLYLGVSFAMTPLKEIGPKANAIMALGWEYNGRGDPWSVSFRRDCPEEGASSAVSEVKELMGDYWLDADGITALNALAHPLDG